MQFSGLPPPIVITQWGHLMKLKALALVAFLFVGNTACSEFGPEGTSPVAPTSPSQAAKPPSQVDIPVTTYIEHLDGNGLPADTLSDGLGAYVHSAGGVRSVLTANVFNGLTHGDWQFSASGTSGRRFGIALDSDDAVQPGDPAYLVAATPPYWGTKIVPGNINIMCTFVNRSMKTMTAGGSFECPLGTNFAFNGITYHRGAARSFNGFPETTDVQVVCNAADAGGCNDWFIEPIGQDRAIARLMRENKPGKPRTHIGTFYVRFRIHVTRP